MRALGLFSGGLDSLLAARLLQEQGIRVECVHFDTGFCKRTHLEVVRRCPPTTLGQALRNWRPPVRSVDLSAAYVALLRTPRHGFGRAMNPCLDCRVLMLREAARLASSRGISLLFTGDVIGQRAMDQSRGALERIDGEAALEGRVLRPLCAAHLPATPAEVRGVVDRSRLGAMHGRSREAQVRLARSLGVSTYPTPSGGCCLLADPAFAARVRDVLAHGEDDPARHDLELLRRGRHFRVAWNCKVVLGRNHEDNVWLERESRDWTRLRARDREGPTALVAPGADPRGLERAARLVARYCRGDGDGAIVVCVEDAAGGRELPAHPATDAETASWRL